MFLLTTQTSAMLVDVTPLWDRGSLLFLIYMLHSARRFTSWHACKYLIIYHHYPRPTALTRLPMDSNNDQYPSIIIGAMPGSLQCLATI